MIVWLVVTLTLELVLAAEPTLDKHLIPLYGNATLGYYYANIYVGTPPQEQSVIIDTGSGHLALPCSKCTNCGKKHIHPPFDLRASAAAKILTCNSQEELCVNSCSRKEPTDPCTFSINYAEGSSLSGIILEDEIQFEADSMGESVRTAFGCTTRETNLFVTQEANGIFGLAPKRQAKLLDLLYQKHSVMTGERLMFSLCLAKNGGQLVIGKPKEELHRAGSQAVKTRFNPAKNLYSLEGVGDVTMGEYTIHKSGDFTGVYGFFIDSGSTFTYLPRSNFKNLEMALENACSLVPEKCLVAKGRASCYKITHDENSTIRATLDEIFPSYSIEINGEAVGWSPSHYFLLKSLANGEVCLGLQPLDRFILGANWMVDRDIIFDIPGQTVEIFSEVNCESTPTIELNQQAKEKEELPIYRGDTKPEQLSYIEAVFKMDNSFTTFLVALVLIILCLIAILVVIGKTAGRNTPKARKVSQDEEVEEIKEEELGERRGSEQSPRQGSFIGNEAIAIISPPLREVSQ